VNHAVSGAEFGWRFGTGKWPAYYADSLGAAVDIGIGSPTGVGSGKGAKFPAKYQQAIYVMDWTYGRIMAVHLQPDGASYTGTWENFVAPAGLIDTSKNKAPLNVTDLVIGSDGAMYFTIGGRDTAAGLYRVTYTGSESTAPAWTPNTVGAEARALRRRLESYHGKADTRALDFLWPHLGSSDRSIRYAARIALEAQPVAEWKSRALAEKAADAGINALLALVRVGDKSAQDESWRALGKWPLATLSERQQLDKLRVLQVSIARHGLPPSEIVPLATEKLSAAYPNKGSLVNRELSQVLIALGAPDVVAKTLPLMASAKSHEDLMHYMFHLRTAKHWTTEQRREYFAYWTSDRKGYPSDAKLVKWFEEAGRPYSHGASYNNFLKNFLKDAAENLNETEKTEFAPILAAFSSPAPIRKRATEFPAPKERTFVKSWTMADFVGQLDSAASTRNFQSGRQAFVDAQCLACHRMGDEGGGVGPDLTAISSRFKRIDMLESILDPNKVLSEQFQNTTVFTKDGEDHTGRLVDETPEQIVLVPNQLEPGKHVVVNKSDISSRRASTVSPMPAGLADVLSRDEILDLLAFLESGGRPPAQASKQ
jgi:putative heme-binding domain-containing protein